MNDLRPLDHAHPISFLVLPLHHHRAALCRLGLGLLLALSAGLALRAPDAPMRLPDAWAYAFALENFASGRWVVSEEALAAGQMQARLEGGHLVQYVRVGPDRWALEKAPGFPLLAAPFQWLGVSRWTNSILAALAACALYALVARWRGEALACAAAALLLLAPMSLAAQRDAWMDTFASGALPAIGGALYALFHLRGARDRAGLALLFGAGLALGGSVVVRLTNAPLPGLIGLHLLLAGWRAAQIKPNRSDRRAWAGALLCFAAGAALALSVLLVYNQAVFGRPLDTGYAYSPFRISSAFGPAIGKPGVPVADASLAAAIHLTGRTLVRLLLPWLAGFPLLLLAVPGWRIARRPSEPRALLPLWLSMSWVLAVMAPYLSFTWLDQVLSRGGAGLESFADVDRYFFPWIFPLILLALVSLDRLPRPAAWAVCLLYGTGSLWFYAQVVP